MNTRTTPVRTKEMAQGRRAWRSALRCATLPLLAGTILAVGPRAAQAQDQGCGELGVNIASQKTHPMPLNVEDQGVQLLDDLKDALRPNRGLDGPDGTCSGNGLGLMYPFDVNNTAGWTLALARGDDLSSALINLGFTFQFYGTNYTSCYINNNGNITFGAPYSTYVPTGFPSSTVPPMIAPFWADVDTRNTATGRVWYKIIDSNNGGLPDTLIVTWDDVGYFNQHADLLNTFQVAISNFTNPVMQPGSNVCFDYDNMCWTTGDINGVGGFTDPPSATTGNAVVGINRGSGGDYFQVGRFGENNSTYDGPFGGADGVSYLDNRRFCFNTQTGNVPPVAANLPTANTYNVAAGQVLNAQIQFLSPEFGQTTTITVIDQDNAVGAGLVITPTAGNLARLDLDWTTGCSDVGQYTLLITARDNFSPQGVTQVTLTIRVTEVNTLPTVSITSPTPFSGSCTSAAIIGTATGTNFGSYVLEYGANPSGPWTLFASGSSPVVNGPLGVWNFGALAAGYYFVRLRAANDCGPIATYTTVLAKCSAPVVAQQPTSETVLEGGMACFRVRDGSFCGASFQWQRNNVNVVDGPRISGATTDQLDINPVQAGDAGNYRCVLTNSCGVVNSNAGRLTVTCYANCDGSTTPPTLNVLDFSCFLNKFAAGCP